MTNFSQTSTWRANFRPHLDGVRCRWDDLRLNLIAGKCYQLTLEFDGSYLIDDPESAIAIYCVPDSNLSGIEFAPEEGKLIEMVRDPNPFSSLTWTISTERAHHGPFQIYFKMPGYDGMPDSPKISGRVENLIIASLTCDRTVTYTGYEINAQVLVLASPMGLPVSGIALKCLYADQTLPEVITNEKGVASFAFVVTDVGEHDLVVSSAAGSSDSKTQKILVQALQPARVYGVSAYPLSLHVGESSNISATIRHVLTQQPLEGRKVHWVVDNQEFDTSYTLASGKTETNWIANRPGAATIWAYVYNQSNTEVGSVDLNVL